MSRSRRRQLSLREAGGFNSSPQRQLHPIFPSLPPDITSHSRFIPPARWSQRRVKPTNSIREPLSDGQ